MIWLGWLACTGSTPIERTDELALQQQTLAAIHADIVGQEYALFGTQSSLMADAVKDLCDGPTEQSLADAQQAWRDARRPFKRMEVVGFGPVVDLPGRFGPLVDFWPVRDTVVDDLLSSTDPVDEAAVQNMGSSARGLPVIEYLLWHPVSGAVEDLDDRRCQYLTALAVDVASNADGLALAWNDYAMALDDPAGHPDLVYASTQEVLNEWINRLLFAIDNIRAEKLGKPLGDDNQGVPVPTSVESPYSDASLQDAQDVFAGVELLLDGRNQGAGLLDLMTDDRTPLGFREDMQAARDAAHQALSGLAQPLQDTVVSDPASVLAAQDALREVQVLIQVDMAQSLAVPLSFNDNDGD